MAHSSADDSRYFDHRYYLLGVKNLGGKLSIALTEPWIKIGLAIWVVWLDRRPGKFTDWL